MRISELSRYAGVPTSTIKYYIRLGLLPSGKLSHRNQAEYDEDHLRRLDLIKTLREVVGLSVDDVTAVLDQIERPWGEGDPIGVALEAERPTSERRRSEQEVAMFETAQVEIEEFMDNLTWIRDMNAVTHKRQQQTSEIVADTLVQLRRYIDADFKVERVEKIAQAIWLLSEAIVGGYEDYMPQPGEDLVEPTQSAVLGTLFTEKLSVALLRMANTMRHAHITEKWPLPRPHLNDLEPQTD